MLSGFLAVDRTGGERRLRVAQLICSIGAERGEGLL